MSWVSDLAEAAKLPRVPFDGVLLEAEGAGAIGRGVPVIVCLPPSGTEASQAVLAACAAAVLLLDPEAVRLGFVRAVGDALDAEHERAAVRAPRLPIPLSAANARSAANGAIQANTADAAHTPDASDALAPPFVTRSEAMREVAELVAVAASSPSSVLLSGETGASKEVVARQLHTRSERAALPSVAINCAPFPEALLEASSSARCRARSPAPIGASPASSRPLAPARSFSTRSPRWSSRCKPSPCAPCRSARSAQLAQHARSPSPAGSRHFLALHGPREGKQGCHLSLATAQLLECYVWPDSVRELENEMLRVLMGLARTAPRIPTRIAHRAQ